MVSEIRKNDIPKSRLAYTLVKTNGAPENRPPQKQKSKFDLQTINFQELC